MHGAMRIIDATSNRAREALRTLEDIARFALDAPALTQRAKALVTTSPWPSPALTRWTPGRARPEATSEPPSRRRASSTALARRGGRGCRRAAHRGPAIARGSRRVRAGADARTLERVRYEAYSLERDLRAAVGGRPCAVAAVRAHHRVAVHPPAVG
jgi:hypothetical protein